MRGFRSWFPPYSTTVSCSVIPRRPSRASNVSWSTKFRRTRSCSSCFQWRATAPGIWPRAYASVSSSTSTRCTTGSPRRSATQAVLTRTSRLPLLSLISSLRCHVDSAFLVASLPPPAPGPDVFARRRGAGAGSAADARVPLRVERVAGQIVRQGVGLHLLQAPGRQGIDLEDAAVRLVGRDRRGGCPGRALRAAEAGDPCVQRGQARGQWPHLSNVADREPQVHGSVEGVDS